MSAARTFALVISFLAISAAAAFATPQERTTATNGGRSGREVFEATCIACHGPDGRGQANPALTKILPLPDFTDCNFAVREPSTDWLAVAHDGGPARGFSPGPSRHRPTAAAGNA